ncbi:MAG: 4-hydroxythreonine-4-phosphate dehydrogenase PdxA [Bacteroidaceae bacterium]|nr:4-hydroxythreonine-4-phosphate dehydrogenase PdxA [Bacteroidaceae bacterium]
MEKIKVGITHGDINGVGYEIIFKTFQDEEMFDLCTPIVYGSPKVATYHRKSLNIQTNFVVRNSVEEAEDRCLNIVNCFGENEIKVDFGIATEEAGKAAFIALNQAMQDLNQGKIDVLVTAPLTNNTIRGKESIFPGHSTYIEKKLGNSNKALVMLMSQELRVALATTNIPVNKISETITSDLLTEKLETLNETLKRDFCIDGPRIAVLSLNPDFETNTNQDSEENKIIIPTIQELFNNKKVRCFGPYSADSFFENKGYTHFDAVLAMYHDQGLAPFKAISMDEGVKYTAGLPVIRTAPAHGTEYEIAGQGDASEYSIRQAIFEAIDIFRFRNNYDQAHAHPLKRQYYEKRDDSDKLKLDQVTENEEL